MTSAKEGGPARGSAAARLRLVRRVANVLVPLENAEVTADVENRPIGASEEHPRLLRTDLLIAASDLRIRVATLPGRDASVFDEDGLLRAALVMLLDNPDTTAVVVVVDDDDMTAKLIEPSDEPGAVQARLDGAGDEPKWRFGPLGQVVRTYLRQVSPVWDDVSPLAARHDDFRSEARTIATVALAELQGHRKNTPEWRTARQSLGTGDVEWAASLAIRLRLEPDIDVDGVLEAQARGGKSA